MQKLDESLSKSRIELFTTSTASDIKTKKDCYRLRALLDAKKIIFTEVDLASHLWKRRQMLVRSGNLNALPQLHAYGKFIGDLSRVQELEDFGELEKTLQEALEEALSASAQQDEYSSATDEENGLSLPAHDSDAEESSPDSQDSGDSKSPSVAIPDEGGVANQSRSETEATASEATSSESAGSEAMAREATDVQAAGSEATASEGTDLEAAGSGATSPEATNLEAAGSDTAVSEAAGSKGAGSDATGSQATGSEHSSLTPSPPSSPLRGIQSTGSFEFAQRCTTSSHSSEAAASKVSEEPLQQNGHPSTSHSGRASGEISSQSHKFSEEVSSRQSSETSELLSEPPEQPLVEELAISLPDSPVEAAREEDFFTPGVHELGQMTSSGGLPDSPSAVRRSSFVTAADDAGHLFGGLKPVSVFQSSKQASKEQQQARADSLPCNSGRIAEQPQKPKRRSSCGIIRGADRAREDAELSDDAKEDSLDARFQILDASDVFSLSDGRTPPLADLDSFEPISLAKAVSMDIQQAALPSESAPMEDSQEALSDTGADNKDSSSESESPDNIRRLRLQDSRVQKELGSRNGHSSDVSSQKAQPSNKNRRRAHSK